MTRRRLSSLAKAFLTLSLSALLVAGCDSSDDDAIDPGDNNVTENDGSGSGTTGGTGVGNTIPAVAFIADSPDNNIPIPGAQLSNLDTGEVQQADENGEVKTEFERTDEEFDSFRFLVSENPTDLSLSPVSGNIYTVTLASVADNSATIEFTLYQSPGFGESNNAALTFFPDSETPLGNITLDAAGGEDNLIVCDSSTERQCDITIAGSADATFLNGSATYSVALWAQHATDHSDTGFFLFPIDTIDSTEWTRTINLAAELPAEILVEGNIITTGLLVSAGKFTEATRVNTLFDDPDVVEVIVGPDVTVKP